VHEPHETVSPANRTVRAVIFWQGGSDAKNQEDALSWKDRFRAFVADLRAEFGNPDLPIIMVMLGDPAAKVAKKYPYWQVVRAQQHALNIPGVTKIEANGYERKADGISPRRASSLLDQHLRVCCPPPEVNGGTEPRGMTAGQRPR
jgi:hypothetical protein